MGVDLGRFYVAMAQLFLNRANVRSRLKQMRGERSGTIGGTVFGEGCNEMQSFL